MLSAWVVSIVIVWALPGEHNLSIVIVSYHSITHPILFHYHHHHHHLLHYPSPSSLLPIPNYPSSIHLGLDTIRSRTPLHSYKLNRPSASRKKAKAGVKPSKRLALTTDRDPRSETRIPLPSHCSRQLHKRHELSVPLDTDLPQRKGDVKRNHTHTLFLRNAIYAFTLAVTKRRFLI